MSMYATARPASSTRDNGIGQSARFETLRASWGRYWRYRRTLNELAALSARDLADLGLHRSMLRRVAYQATYDGR